jgi:hypothetical protein
MSDPPVHHEPPPFTSEDIRISPSGPYIPGGVGGGIILFGADAVEDDIQLTQSNSHFLPLPRNTGGDPLAVTFPSWGSGNVLWISWAVSGIWIPTEDETAVLLIVQPTIKTDGGGAKLINPGQVISKPLIDGGKAIGVSLAGTCALRVTNPTQPPIVQLYYELATADPTTNFSIAGINQPSELSGSAWLVAAEVANAIAFQLPTVALQTPP